MFEILVLSLTFKRAQNDLYYIIDFSSINTEDSQIIRSEKSPRNYDHSTQNRKLHQTVVTVCFRKNHP